MTFDAVGLCSWMHTSNVGFGVSAETEDIAETVTPERPAGPSVVTILTVQAAWLIPMRNLCLTSGAVDSDIWSAMSCWKDSKLSLRLIWTSERTTGDWSEKFSIKSTINKVWSNSNSRWYCNFELRPKRWTFNRSWGQWNGCRQRINFKQSVVWLQVDQLADMIRESEANQLGSKCKGKLNQNFHFKQWIGDCRELEGVKESRLQGPI